jgi:hypothetical protein
MSCEIPQGLLFHSKFLSLFSHPRAAEVSPDSPASRLSIRWLKDLILQANPSFPAQPLVAMAQQDSQAQPTQTLKNEQVAGTSPSCMSDELQQLADGIRAINPLMAEVLDDSARMVADMHWLF